MVSSTKIAYQTIADQYRLPILCQAWWWEAASTGKQWDILTVRDKEGQMVGAVPYHILRKWCFNAIVMPPRTQRTYLWVHPNANENEVLESLYEELAKVRQHYHALFVYLQMGLTEGQVEFFRKKGYLVQERYTYCIPLEQDEETLYRSFSENKHRQIKRANRLCRLSEIDKDTFYQFHTDTLRQRGRKIEYPQDVWNALYEASTSRSQGKTLAAVDESGTILAAIFLIWDSQRCYALLPVYSPEYKDSGAMAWLTYESIRFAKKVSGIYDFEGSMDPGIALSYRQYGSTQERYFSVSKGQTILRILNTIVQFIKRLTA